MFESIYVTVSIELNKHIHFERTSRQIGRQTMLSND